MQVEETPDGAGSRNQRKVQILRGNDGNSRTSPNGGAFKRKESDAWVLTYVPEEYQTSEEPS